MGWMDKYQDGGKVPKDYDKFLEYSKTAPENRAPDSAWRYGNPRQYDHYGMWDALGKPNDFDEALIKNPDWKPNELDGMYHGFSTNPNTGVWLKSHIAGEKEPGNTGWMENLAFQLSTDSNWNPNKFSLVYDPEIKRLRYIERENRQNGGFLGTTNKGRNYSPAWGGQFQSGGSINLEPVEIKGISPRQQAYNDSLTMYQMGKRYRELLESGKYDRKWEGDSTPKGTEGFGEYKVGTPDSRIPNYFSSYKNMPTDIGLYKYKIDEFNKISKQLGKEFGINKLGKYSPYLGWQWTDSGKINNNGLGSYDDNVFIYSNTYKKPVVNPSENPLFRIRPQESFTQQEQQINPKKVLNEYSIPDPNYHNLNTIIDARTNKPIYLEDKKGNRAPYSSMYNMRNGGEIMNVANEQNPIAQNGTEMRYYQQGLDYKPRTISQNGSKVTKLKQEGESSPISKYDDLITKAAEKYDIPPSVYHRLIYEESKHVPNTKSGKKAFGLSQIIPSTAKAYGLNYNKLSDPSYAIDAGAKILKASYDDKRVGNWKDAIGYYNSGNAWFTEEGRKKSMKKSPLYYKNIYREIDMLNSLDPSLIQPIPVSVADKTFVAQQKDGGTVKDNLGYWNPDNWGKPVEIGSNNITMEGVDRELLGVSDTGDTKLLKPGKNYKFKGKKVTEYPIAKYGIGELNNLTNFTNYNKPSNWLNKYS